jgi:dimethylargininase
LFTHAIVRKPGSNFRQGLTTTHLKPGRYSELLKQHTAYVDILRELGLEIIELDPQPDFPDAYFVEDTAVVTPDVAVITIPGAPARQGEENTIAPVLARYRETIHIQPPATVDGGDVLMVGKHFFIGISDRTNVAGTEELGGILEKYGNTWQTVVVGEGLHLKSSVNYVGKNTLLLTKEFQGHKFFDRYAKIILDEDETYAANTLLINDCLLMPAGYPRTRTRLENLNYRIIELNVSEVRKMDGGLTCMSLRF